MEEIHEEIIEKAVRKLNKSMDASSPRKPIPFNDFLELVAKNPRASIRSVFQVFHDMIKTYVGKGFDEYPDDPESVGFVKYDFKNLFVEDSDRPFFADRLFSNRLINLTKSMRQGAQQNKIYIFEGPPGCGKSTFLNNLLSRFEKYSNTGEGTRYEIVWRLNRHELGGFIENDVIPIIEHYAPAEAHQEPVDHRTIFSKHSVIHETDEYVEIPCPSHDNPILMIPKDYRREFFDSLFKNDKFKWKMFTQKEYEWIFRDNPCTICSSIYKALADKLDHPSKAFEMLYATEYRLDRRLGEGVSVFNPGDKPVKHIMVTNEMLQHRLDSLLKDSNRVRYVFSNYARTNNGIYALMDIKSHNKDRLIELHNIISEGVHKVGHIEENVHSLFMALMNPEDKKNVESIQSFMDRIEYVKVPYVLDISTELDIYRNIFGKHIDANFLPKVMHNFARVIVSTRLTPRSEALLEWIKDPKKYELYCDKNLHLLKMEMYTGNIPSWLTEEDKKKLDAPRRKKILKESEKDGEKGFSGRDAITIFNEFYATYACEDKLINMVMIKTFFEKKMKTHPRLIPDGFLDSLCQMYDFNTLQEVKECLYNYNEEKISSDIQDYLFALNFELDASVKCVYTGRKFTVTEGFLKSVERFFIGEGADAKKRTEFRKDTQKEYASKTLTQEIMVEDKPITETDLFEKLQEKYEYNLKEKVMDPFLENENFRMAIKDYGTDDFRTYDDSIREDVTFMISNLVKKFGYTEKGAKEICIYVVDNDLAKKFVKK